MEHELNLGGADETASAVSPFYVRETGQIGRRTG